MSMVNLESEWLSRLPGLGELWAVTRGHPAVRVAVLDGPVDRGAVADGLLSPSGVIEHGTLIASIISGSRAGDVSGIAPGCRTMSIPIFREPERGEPVVCSQETLAAAIRDALHARAHVINISAAQQVDLLHLSAVLSAALEEALAADVLVVAAAGNHGCACETIPASVAGVLAVGAHDATGAPLLVSNWGSGQRADGILAPGLGIPGACVGGGLCRGTGTSFATAVVSGAAALLLSLGLQRGRAPSGSAIRRLLVDTADPCRPEVAALCSPYLSGRLNLRRAADRLLSSSEEWEGMVRTSETIPDGLASAAAPVLALQTEPAGDPAPALPGAPALATRPDGLQPADCGCGGTCGGDCKCKGAAAAVKRPQLAYVIGRLGVSFVSQARRDSVWRRLNADRELDTKPIREADLLSLLREEPHLAESMVWTLSRTEVPMYAIVPTGAFAAETYRWLVEEWSDQDVEFVSIPGVLAGSARLYDGSQVDVLVPDRRGMFSWENSRFSRAVAGAVATAETAAADGAPTDAIRRNVERFLGKIMYRIRNRGLSPEERALNAAATNAFNFGEVITQAREEGLTFKDVAVERSPLNRAGSEYFDVVLSFFDPKDRTGTAILTARFTIDVSDTVPVMIGDPVTWYEY